MYLRVSFWYYYYVNYDEVFCELGIPIQSEFMAEFTFIIYLQEKLIVPILRAAKNDPSCRARLLVVVFVFF